MVSKEFVVYMFWRMIPYVVFFAIGRVIGGVMRYYWG